MASRSAPFIRIFSFFLCCTSRKWFFVISPVHLKCFVKWMHKCEKWTSELGIRVLFEFRFIVSNIEWEEFCETKIKSNVKFAVWSCFEFVWQILNFSICIKNCLQNYFNKMNFKYFNQWKMGKNTQKILKIISHLDINLKVIKLFHYSSRKYLKNCEIKEIKI